MAGTAGMWQLLLRPSGEHRGGSGPMSVPGRAGGKKTRLLAVRLGAQHLAPLAELCQAGKVAIVIDRRYPPSQVPQALRYRGGGHAKGRSSSPSYDQ